MYTYKLGGMLITDELYHDDLEAMTFGRKDQNELMHYGIKGQSWGKRRFQNEDGSLTMAGRNRYDVGDPRQGVTAYSDTGRRGGSGVSYTRLPAGSGGANRTTGSTGSVGTKPVNIPRATGVSQQTRNNIAASSSAMRDRVANSAATGKKAADNLFSRIGNWATTAANDVGKAATSAYNDASKWAGNAAKDVGNWVGDRAQDVGNAAKDLGNKVVNEVSALSNTPEYRDAANAVNAAKNWVGNAGRDVGNFVTNTANDASKAVGKAAKDVGNAIGNAAKNAGDWASNAASDVRDWGAGALDKGRQAFESLFGKSEPPKVESLDPTPKTFTENIIREQVIPEQRIEEQRIPEQPIEEQRIPENREIETRPTVSGSNNVQTWDNGNINTWDNVKTIGDPGMADIARQYMNQQNSSSSSNAQREQRRQETLSDKPDNVSNEFWEEYKANGGTRDAYERELKNRKSSAVPVSSDKDYVAEQERLRNISAQQDRNGYRAEEVNAPVGTVDNSRPHHFTYDPASGQTIVVYDDEKRR